MTSTSLSKATASSSSSNSSHSYSRLAHIGTPYGLSWWELQQCVDKVCGGKERAEDLTLHDIHTQFILPYTAASKLSYVDMISSTDGEVNLRRFSRNKRSQLPCVLVSCSWRQPLSNVLDSIEQFLQKHPSLTDQIVLWLDLFCMNYHCAYERKEEYRTDWANFIENVTVDIGHCITATPTVTDTITLPAFESALGLYQFYICNLGNFYCDVMISGSIDTKEEGKQSSAVLKKEEVLDQHLHSQVKKLFPLEVGIENALFESEQLGRGPAGYETRLFASIIECSDTHQRLQHQLRGNLLNCLERNQKGSIFIYVCHQSLYWMSLHPDINAAQLLHERLSMDSTPDEVEYILLNLLDKFRKLFVHDKEYERQLSITSNTLAEVFHGNGKITMAEVTYVSLVDFHLENNPPTHAKCIMARQKLAYFYSNQGQYSKAQPLVEENYRSSKESMGEEHPVTFQSLSMLANNYVNQGKFEEAHEHASYCVELARRQYGQDHPAIKVYEGNLQSIAIAHELSRQQASQPQNNRYRSNSNSMRTEAKISSDVHNQYDLEMGRFNNRHQPNCNIS